MLEALVTTRANGQERYIVHSEGPEVASEEWLSVHSGAALDLGDWR